MSRLQHALEVGLHNRAILLSRVGGPFNVAGKGIVITDVPKTEEDRNKLSSPRWQLPPRPLGKRRPTEDCGRLVQNCLRSKTQLAPPTLAS